MKKIIVIIFLLATVTVSAQDIPADDTTAKPAVTEIGKPVGAKTEMKMGKDGGSFTSPDGKVELIIPEGAISKKTTFSIQPVTNLMPNGNGKAYRLEPSAIQFQKPVQLVFHYEPEESPDSMQLLMGIAMQDNTGQWYSLKKFTLDTATKTISGNINHFSDWTKFDVIKINPDKARVKINKKIVLQFSGMEPFPKQTDGPDLTFLNRTAKNALWRVNNIVQGNSVVGTLQYGTADYFKPFNIYNAPASVPDQNPVAISVKLQTVKYNGINFKDLTLLSNILIYDNAYEIKMISSYKGYAERSTVGSFTYKDTGSFVVSLNGEESKIIEKINKNSNAELDYKGKCTVKQLKPGWGHIHIIKAQSIKVIPPTSPTEPAWVEITFPHTPTIFPLLHFTCPNNAGGTFTGTNAQANAMSARLPAFPSSQYPLKFKAIEEEQTIMQFGEEGGDVFFKMTVRQLKED